MSRFQVTVNPETGEVLCIAEQWDGDGNYLNPNNILTPGNGETSDGLGFTDVIPLLKQCEEKPLVSIGEVCFQE